MKTPSLLRLLVAATLFLAVDALPGWTQADTKVDPKPTPADRPATAPAFVQSGPAESSAALARVLRAALAADPAQLRRFDRNRNGKLDDDEWRVARVVILHELGGTVALNTPPADERRRLDAVAAEVARRRALREKAGETPEAAAASVAVEIKRREMVAAEIEERRKQREKIGASPTPPQTHQEKSEQEAKLLVKDLLEIGIAQRREYEEARTRAAEVENKKAADPAKK